jgi:hypothetical protein
MAAAKPVIYNIEIHTKYSEQNSVSMILRGFPTDSSVVGCHEFNGAIADVEPFNRMSKFNMAAVKPEVLISQLLDNYIATPFQRLTPFFGTHAINVMLSRS